MKVSVVGSGYVGLVTGVCLAEKGHKVICVDQDKEKVKNIDNAISPIYEKGLDELLKKNVNVNLKATRNLHQSVLETEVTFIAVGTPFNGKEIDLSYIKEVSRLVGMALKEKSTYHLVVVKSTVTPGTTDQVVLPILEKYSGKKATIDFGIGMNPEFLREGEAIQDFMHPDRLVLGGSDKKAIDTLDNLYGIFEGVQKIRTNNKTAEMIKYTSNSLLATMISFSNEIANLSAAIEGIDVVDVMKGVHLDKRLSPILPNGERIVPFFTTYLEAGCGFGGSCFPKDVKALIAQGKRIARPLALLETVMRINEEQPKHVLSLLKKHYPSLKGLHIAVLGLAFKPGTDDMRESPAIPIINYLLAEEAIITAYDPVAKNEAMKMFGNFNIRYCDNLCEAITEVEAIILVTRWEEFREIPELLVDLHPQPLFIDGRRMLDKNSIPRYEGIGL